MKIGVICALEEEIGLLKDYFVYEGETTCGSVKVTEVSLFSNRLFFTISGVGKVNAGIAAQVLISEMKCDIILNTGLAGGCSDDLHPGSAVLARGAVYHDFHANVIDAELGSKIFYSNPRLNAYATDILNSLGFHYTVGLVASGDMFVSDEEVKNDIVSRTDCVCVDMELAAIAHVASLNDVPYLSLKIISDNADEKALTDFYFSLNTYVSYCSSFIYSLAKEMPYRTV